MPAHGGGSQGFIPRAGTETGSKPRWLPKGSALICCALPSKEGVKAQLVQVFWDWEHWWVWKGVGWS